MISRFRVFTLLVLLFSTVAFAQNNTDEQRPPPVFAEGLAPVEVVVTGRHPGPPLWKVTNGDNVLWIFPYVSPLPKRMIWDSSRVERLIEESQEYLEEPVVDLNFRFRRSSINIPDKQTLEDVLPADLYEHLLALDETGIIRINKKHSRMSPLVAGPSIVSRVISNSGLESGNSILKKIRKEARRNKTMIRTEIIGVVDKETTLVMKEYLTSAAKIEADSEQSFTCFAYSLERVATEVDVLIRRANAWATGNAGQLISNELQGSGSNPCSINLTDDPVLDEEYKRLVENTNNDWLDAAEKALNRNTSTFAVLSLSQLLNEDGFLQALEARGFNVQVP